MRIPFSLVAIIFTSSTLVSQFDTVALKKMVTSINTEREHIEFWKHIHYTDQELGSRTDKEFIDQENLVLISYYLNEFGYPDKKILGTKSSILTTVWVHVASYDAMKTSFPIVLQGYLTRAIDEKGMRGYFVRILYQRYFDDNGNWTKPLGQIYKELGVSVNDKINIPLLVHQIQSWNKFMEMEKDTIGIWQEENINSENYLNGKKITKVIEGAKVIIYKLASGRLFFSYIYKNGIIDYDPVELNLVDATKNIYKAKERLSDDFYRINENSDLENYRQKTGKTLLYLRLD